MTFHRPSPWIEASDLTPAQLAVLSRNYDRMQGYLTSLVAGVQEHRRTGCQQWYCSGTAGPAMNAMTNGQAHLLGRAAVERLALLS